MLLWIGLAVAIIIIVIVVSIVLGSGETVDKRCHPETHNRMDYTSCFAYYDCATNQRHLCPPFQSYNFNTGRCSEATAGHCFMLQCSGNEGTNVPVENNCREYNQCSLAGVVLMTCPQNQCYNLGQDRCVEPGEDDGCECNNNEYDTIATTTEIH
ncbi:ORF72 [Leucania separata nucleopolyhedrovirus]|uniref:ORF72 n=1 Tax=Leucania separata nucleopolyhedrovirus TaxID=1307956 RepID=Q0IL47_NPVLS|nr:ORF72 [Leucania separata nucleopolyhedrovirus]AAR28836.1 ORF72 [Leucania separata nucleopolyhedrovirus]